MTTTLSLSLRKCIRAKDDLPRINDIVEGVSWCLPRLTLFANAVILRMIQYNSDRPEAERIPLPLIDRNFYYKGCFPYACYTTVPRPKRARTTDYTESEMTRAKRRKLTESGISIGRTKMTKLPQDIRDKIDNVELTEEECAEARKVAQERAQAKLDNDGILSSWLSSGVFQEVRDQCGFSSTSFRPDAVKPSTRTDSQGNLVIDERRPFAFKGIGELIEASIQFELVKDSTTYVSETFLRRRRCFLEDRLSVFFKTENHTARIVTHLLQIIDGKIDLSFTATDKIDFDAVVSRIQTADLRKSFPAELQDAENSGLSAACMELLDSPIRTPLPATVTNLKKSPHKFLEALAFILHYREQRVEEMNLKSAQMNEPSETSQDDAEEDEVECVEASGMEYVTTEDLDRKARSLFTLLPVCKSRGTFIYLDGKRAKATGLITHNDGSNWHSELFDLSKSIRQEKNRSRVGSTVRTDGVQLKIMLNRPTGPSEMLVERGYSGLNASESEQIELESRGVYLLDKINSISSEDAIARGVIGLDPGRRDLYASVRSLLPGQTRHISRKMSNDQYKHLQNVDRVKRTDMTWRKRTDVMDYVDSRPSIKTSSYDSLSERIRDRLNAETSEKMWTYQMRRSRRTQRFSQLLSNKSLQDRIADAIVEHRLLVPRRRRGVNGRSTRPDKKQVAREIPSRPQGLLPIVAFGGGQFAAGGSGLRAVPRKLLVRKIAERTVCVIVDEHNTSQMCSHCGNKLKNPDPRPRDCETGACIGPHRSFTQQQKRRLRQCQSEACRVLHGESNVCTSSNSKTTHFRLWNRDVNAAINMLQLALNRIQGLPRPAQLCRKSDSESNKPVKGNPCISRHYGTPLERQLC